MAMTVVHKLEPYANVMSGPVTVCGVRAHEPTERSYVWANVTCAWCLKNRHDAPSETPKE